MKCVLFLDCSKHSGFTTDYFLKLQKYCTAPVAHVCYMGNNSSFEKDHFPPHYVLLHDADPSQGLAKACSIAEANHANLLYINMPILISDAHISSLSRTLLLDPLFGVATPRFSSPTTDMVLRHPTEETSFEADVTRRALAALPPYWITPEFVSACVLIRNTLVANLPDIPPYTSLNGTMLHLCSKARRRGFRTVVDNRTVIKSKCSPLELFPKLTEDDNYTFLTTCSLQFSYPTVFSDKKINSLKKMPEIDDGQAWYEKHIMHTAEALCSAAFPLIHKRRRICIDCRGMMDFFCGTTVCQLGFLQGLQAYADEWEIDVIAQHFALSTHELQKRFSLLNVLPASENVFPRPTKDYAAIIHMNQPCYYSIVQDLHEHGFVTACNILDTITWDIILGCPPQAEHVWGFSAKYLDCIFYNSNFSLSQFNTRFPVATDALQAATLHSFSVEDNVCQEFTKGTPEDYILVFGNNYEHKDVWLTTRHLHSMFPNKQIKSLGPEIAKLDNVTFFQSGRLEDSTIEELISKAQVVVFPSWIEGFGLPVVKALAYGRPVIVRSLPLWKEIASFSRLPGVLMEFEDTESLFETVSGVLNNSFSNVLPQSTALSPTEVVDWKYCAKVILDTIDQYLSTATTTKFLERHVAIQYMPKG